MVKVIETVKGEASQEGEISAIQAAEKFSEFTNTHFEPDNECVQENDGAKVKFTAPNGDTLEMEFASAEEREEMVGGDDGEDEDAD